MASSENFLRSVMLGRDGEMDSDSVNTREASLIRRRGYATAEAHHGRGASFLELEAGSTGWDGGDGGAGGNRREYLTVGQHMIRRAGKMAKLKDLLDEETYIARRRALNQRMKQNILSSGKTSGDAGTPAPRVRGENPRRDSPAPSGSESSLAAPTGGATLPSAASPSPNAETPPAMPGTAATSGSGDSSVAPTVPTVVSEGIDWSPDMSKRSEELPKKQAKTRSPRSPRKSQGSAVDEKKAKESATRLPPKLFDKTDWENNRKEYSEAYKRAHRARGLAEKSGYFDPKLGPGISIGSSTGPGEIQGIRLTDPEVSFIQRARSNWKSGKDPQGNEYRRALDLIQRKRSEAIDRMNAQADFWEEVFDARTSGLNR